MFNAAVETPEFVTDEIKNMCLNFHAAAKCTAPKFSGFFTSSDQGIMKMPEITPNAAS